MEKQLSDTLIHFSLDLIQIVVNYLYYRTPSAWQKNVIFLNAIEAAFVPDTIEWSPDGNLWIAEGNTCDIRSENGEQRGLMKFQKSGIFVDGLAFTDRHAFCIIGRSMMAQISFKGQFEKYIYFDDTVSPWAICSSNDKRHFYIIDHHRSVICQTTLDGRVLCHFDKKMDLPWAIAINHKEEIFVSGSSTSNNIFIYNSDGKCIRTLDIPNAYHMAFYRNGTLVIVVSGKLNFYKEDGTLLCSIENDNFYHPLHVCIDANQRIYVMDKTRKIKVLGFT